MAKAKPTKPKPTKPKPKPTKPKPKPVKPPKGGGFLGNRPAAPKNIDPKAITTTAIQQGNRLSDAQQAEYGQLFGTLANQQRDQVNQIAAGLNNQYTADARAGLASSMDMAQGLGGLGQSLADQSSMGFQTSGPTSIEQELYRQGESELALGRSLSPEQMREAAQSARQAFAARGLGTSMGAAGAELLNRDRYATEREMQRRNFAATANNLREENVMARRDAAGRLGALGGGLMGESGNIMQRGGGLYGELDPYQRALTPGLSLGQTAQQFGLNTTGQNFGNTLELGANAASFNTNMANNLFTNWMDNAAAITGANKQAQATRDASKKGPFDYIVGGVRSIFGG